jgi:DivIVA domain-containing protein
VSSTFPRARRGAPGYNVDQVEDFLEDARRAYASDPNAPAGLTAAGIRTQAFQLQRGGYSAVHVDAALERLEDAFASREREHALARQGDQAWYANARTTAQTILDRLARPAGARFRRTGALVQGYAPKEVDAFTKRLVDYFQQGKPMSVEQVRTVTFATKRGGYQETQVDLLLDAVVDVMLAVR